MRAALLAVFLAAMGTQAQALTCPNQVACEGIIQTQILAAAPVWGAIIDDTCSTMLYVGYPHCAQIVWNGAGIPWIVYGETDIQPGSTWLNHAKAPQHRPISTPDFVLGATQLQVTAFSATFIREYGDVRGGPAPGWWSEIQVCMKKADNTGKVARIYRRNALSDPDGWSDGDLTKCAEDGESPASVAKEP